MVRRAAGVLLLALALAGLPLDAEAQEPSDVPYGRIDTGRDDPYRALDFEVAGARMAPLAHEIIAASAADELFMQFTSAADLGGFQTPTVGSSVWATTGVPLTGVAAPKVATGTLLSTTTSFAITSTTLDNLEAAIPPLSSSGGTVREGRTAFAFTDDAGTAAPPPDDLPPLANPPAPPSEGIAAAPAPTTTEPAPPAGSTSPPTTTAPAIMTTTTPPATATTQAPPTTTTPATPTTTAPPITTTTTRPPTTTTTTRPPTTTVVPTTTVPPTTTTTQAPPTTTTTQPPPAETFSLTQERPSATACVAPTGGTQSCDAIWSVPLAATGATMSFDLSLRNTGNVDATALQLWAGAPCVTTSTASPAGTGDLCAAVELTVQRFTTAARDVPLECVYGGGTAQLCSLSSQRTLSHFSSTHPSSAQARSIGTGLAESEAAHLRLTLRLPDVDNRYQRRTATLSLTWRQVQ